MTDAPNTELATAVVQNDLAGVKNALAAGADPNASLLDAFPKMGGSPSWTVLCLAVGTTSNPMIVRELLEASALPVPDIPDDQREVTAIHLAVDNHLPGGRSVFDQVLSACSPEDLNVTNTTGFSAFGWSVRSHGQGKNREEEKRRIAEIARAGADPDAVNDEGQGFSARDEASRKGMEWVLDLIRTVEDEKLMLSHEPSIKTGDDSTPGVTP